MSDIKIATYNKYYAMGQRAAMAKFAEDPPIPVPQYDPEAARRLSLQGQPTTVNVNGMLVPGPTIPKAPEQATSTTVHRGGIPVPGPSQRFNVPR